MLTVSRYFENFAPAPMGTPIHLLNKTNSPIVKTSNFKKKRRYNPFGKSAIPKYPKNVF